MVYSNSKRAAILAKVLQHINNDDWAEEDGYLVFGKEAFDLSMGNLSGAHSDPDGRGSDFLNKVKINRGETETAKRISLGLPPKDQTSEALANYLSSLSKEVLNAVGEGFAAKSEPIAPSHESNSEATLDALDASFSQTALESLERAMERVAFLDELNIDSALGQNAKYLEEAHRCEFSGLKIACAVLCRAMLDEALIRTVDPQKQIKPRNKQDEKTGPIGLRIKEARRRGLLDGNRKDCAFIIKDAGNAAIHDIKTFNLEYSSRMSEIVDATRKVLIDLFAANGGRRNDRACISRP